jgi:hypothetical protein
VLLSLQKFPVYIWDLGGTRGNFYGFPSEDNCPGEVKVAFHVTNSTPADGVASPEAVDREVHPAEVEAMRAVLAAKIPEMNNELIKTTTCMYTSTCDGHLYVHIDHCVLLAAVADLCLPSVLQCDRLPSGQQRCCAGFAVQRAWIQGKMFCKVALMYCPITGPSFS